MHDFAKHPLRPVLIPVVDHAQGDKGDQRAVASLLATALTQRVAQVCPVTAVDPLPVSKVGVGLKQLLLQGAEQIVLVPWTLQGATADLIGATLLALGRWEKRAVSVTTMVRPLVHVLGASPAGALGGLIVVQERLDPYVAQLPGWQKVYTMLRSGRVHILLPGSLQQHRSHRIERDVSQLEMALLYELCPEVREHGSPRLDTRHINDGAIYANYLVRLLRKAIELAFLPQVLSFESCSNHRQY